MIHLIDNDIVSKLGIYDLYTPFRETFFGEGDSTYLLKTALYSLCKPKTVQRWGQPAVDRIREFINHFPTVEARPEHHADFTSLTEASQHIDEGEAVLFAVGAQLDDFRLYTGDKRSVAALFASGLQPIIDRHIGRTICFEQVIFQMVSHCGLEVIRQGIVAGLEADQAMRSVFGGACEEHNIRRSLASYTRHLRRQSGDLLCDLTLEEEALLD